MGGGFVLRIALRFRLVLLCCLVLLAITGTNMPVLAEPADTETQTLVLVKQISPFVIIEHGKVSGFSIDLWGELADRAGFKTTYQTVDSLAELLDGIENDSADAAIAAVTITAGREAKMDFSPIFFPAFKCWCEAPKPVLHLRYGQPLYPY